MNSNTQTNVIYLDFRKAYNSVCHTYLLNKLHSFGITGRLWDWFKCYLEDRLQCTKISNCSSSSVPVLSGVPQGSILGPFLFIVYIASLTSCVSFLKLLSFADDTKCYQQISDPINSTQLQSDLDSLLNWSILNSLPFNLSKFVHMSFKSKITTSYHIEETIITHCSSHRDLGILFSDKLSWDLHYQKILAKAYKSLWLICRTFKSHGCRHSRKLLYISLVQSKLLFCSPIWKPYLLKHVHTLETLQRRATKYILNDYHTDYKTRLIQLNLLPITYTLDIVPHKESQESYWQFQHLRLCILL